MQIPKNNKLSRAFTLVELLVVISIIGLLMGILIPALNKTRGVASRTYCMSNLRQIGVAFRAYLDDNRDIFPICAAYPWLITDPNADGYAPPITKTLGKILKEPKIFICKADNIVRPPYRLRTGNTSYEYNNRLAGITIRQLPSVQAGAKEKDIQVTSDFTSADPVLKLPNPHPGFGKNKSGGVNYLYADWHVSDYRKQE